MEIQNDYTQTMAAQIKLWNAEINVLKANAGTGLRPHAPSIFMNCMPNSSVRRRNNAGTGKVLRRSMGTGK